MTSCGVFPCGFEVINTQRSLILTSVWCIGGFCFFLWKGFGETSRTGQIVEGSAKLSIFSFWPRFIHLFSICKIHWVVVITLYSASHPHEPYLLSSVGSRVTWLAPNKISVQVGTKPDLFPGLTNTDFQNAKQKKKEKRKKLSRQIDVFHLLPTKSFFLSIHCGGIGGSYQEYLLRSKISI